MGPGQLWWYTHLGLRRARGTLATTIKAGHPFTWLTSAAEGQNITRTTSLLEGGINADSKTFYAITEASARTTPRARSTGTSTSAPNYPKLPGTW